MLTIIIVNTIAFLVMVVGSFLLGHLGLSCMERIDRFLSTRNR